MYYLVMVIGANHRVLMPKDTNLTLSEAAYRMEVYKRKNPNATFLAMYGDQIVMEL